MIKIAKILDYYEQNHKIQKSQKSQKIKKIPYRAKIDNNHIKWMQNSK